MTRATNIPQRWIRV